MPDGLIEVVSGGPGCTVQDAGRFGHRHEGVAQAGWLVPPWADAANVLVGNPAGVAGLEWRGPGLVLQVVRGPVRVAVAGHVRVDVSRGEGPTRPLGAWRSGTLAEGDRLHLGAAVDGCACLALGGGVQVPLVLGSRSTHVRTGFGGLDGRMLAPGDRLPCHSHLASGRGERRSLSPLALPAGPIRVLWGPQDDHFTAQSRTRFLDTDWRVTAEQDRMGMRLAGPPLVHIGAAAADIVSDGAVPGAIQVPANGLPVVLLADGQTVGGYPKIATVIRADLPRLALMPAGCHLRFEAVDAPTARRALLAAQAQWQAWSAALLSCKPEGWLDEAALCTDNLVSGMLRAEF
ncbi:biotin-dependent carboxyltransferase family protein [Sphaerotilus sp.]|uniref:5-oxoprolinase subunit C family protein n=1 Tax=Sphaerotilus sp. TaxID=2093942 RepID=UPI0034E1C51C